MGIGSRTCSSNRTHFLPIRQEFVFFARGERKGLTYPGLDIVYVRWSNIFTKCGGTILKLSFGGCFTKRPVFCARKMENRFSVRRRGKILLQHYSPSHDTYVCTIWAHYHKLCLDSSHNTGHLTRKP